MHRKTGRSFARSVLRAFVLAAPLAIVGCASAGKVAPEFLFTDARGMIGQKVVARGLVHFRFEDRSLYPERQVDRARDENACLPILVETSNESMAARMRAIDGQVATISGEIVSLIEPGMDSVGTCRNYGIVVEAVDGK